MRNILLIFALLLVGCDIPIKPDFVKDGKEYIITEPCVKSHVESKYEYHYGYNMMEGKFNWHWGLNNTTICDSTTLDTLEINLEKKYYSKK